MMGHVHEHLFSILHVNILLLFPLFSRSCHRLLRADRRADALAVLTSLRCKKDAALVEEELVALEQELGASMNQPAASWSEVSST